MVSNVFRKMVMAASEAVFPSGLYCISCGSLIDRSRSYELCDECIQKIHWITGKSCRKCGKALPDTYHADICYDCIKFGHSFDRGFSCFTYGLYERRLIFDFKYNGKKYLAEPFGDILFDRISPEQLNIDLILPVPVHKNREKKRGYNQAALLAEALGKRMSVRYDTTSLRRVTDTHLLRSMTPAEREAALEGAFKAFGKNINGKSVLLIDDIFTTGATADECSRVLRKAGADTVYLLTLASGGNRHSGE